MRRALLAVALILSLGAPACGFSRDLKAIATLQSRIKADVGVDANVNFRTVNGVTTVSITLASLPAGDPKVTKAKVEALAHSEFPAATNIIILAAL